MKKGYLIAAAVALVTILTMGDGGGCSNGSTTPTSDNLTSQQQENNLAQASRDVGMPAVINYTEKRLLKQLYEDRDNPTLITYTYMQSTMTGLLTCLGKSIGYGIPYATQYSNPQHLVKANCGQYCSEEPMAQAEPNGLFPPASAEGTWVFLYDAASKNTQPLYVEPPVTVSRFPLHGPAVAKECPEDTNTTTTNGTPNGK